MGHFFDNVTPLEHSCIHGHSNVVAVLLRHLGPDAAAAASSVAGKRWTAVHWAARGESDGHVEALRLLLEAGANPRCTSKSGRVRPLMSAARPEAVELLLAVAGPEALMDTAHYSGWTALHYAAKDWRTDAAQALVRAGADKQAVDKAGKTPAQVALAFGRGHTDLATELAPAPPGAAAQLERQLAEERRRALGLQWQVAQLREAAAAATRAAVQAGVVAPADAAPSHDDGDGALRVAGAGSAMRTTVAATAVTPLQNAPSSQKQQQQQQQQQEEQQTRHAASPGGGTAAQHDPLAAPARRSDETVGARETAAAQEGATAADAKVRFRQALATLNVERARLRGRERPMTLAELAPWGAEFAASRAAVCCDERELQKRDAVQIGLDGETAEFLPYDEQGLSVFHSADPSKTGHQDRFVIKVGLAALGLPLDYE
jgi:hypothetical protein